MTRLSFAEAAAAPALALLIACASAGCGDGETPSLKNFTFDGQAQDSPLVLLLRDDFEDPDGNLANGSLTTFINDRATSAGDLELFPIFVQSGVDPEATSGRLEFVLELSFVDGPPEDGTSFELGARAVDEDGNASSTQELRLALSSE